MVMVIEITMATDIAGRVRELREKISRYSLLKSEEKEGRKSVFRERRRA